MIETVETEPGKVSVRATVRRLSVYLDNYSIISFAKGEADRRERLIQAFEHGADLMFSPANAAEIIGSERESSLDAIRKFLNSVGPHWFPVEGADIVAVLEREAAGADRADACTSTWFMNQFFAGRSIQLHGEQRLELVDSRFFQLGFVLDWLGPQRSDLRRRVGEFDLRLAEKLVELRRAYDQNRRGFDQHVAAPQWDPNRPATFVWQGLVRRLIFDGKAFTFKKGDGADFCHAVIGAAFANFATLDKHWKRRILSLPQPNGLARIYYEPELDQLVNDVENAVSIEIAG
jgi:hypothetical protein